MRKTKIIGFSIPPEIYKKFDSVLRAKHKTKSEFFREVLDIYFNSAKPDNISEGNVANALKTYWNLRSASRANVIIIGLAVVSRGGKVLIGARKIKDKWVENLHWVFPGGKINSLNFEREIRKRIKEGTRLDVEVKNLVAARIHPDSGFKDVQIVALYFHCEALKSQKEMAGGELARLKWVKPSSVFKYFTTSVNDDVTKFLMMLEKESV